MKLKVFLLSICLFVCVGLCSIPAYSTVEPVVQQQQTVPETIPEKNMSSLKKIKDKTSVFTIIFTLGGILILIGAARFFMMVYAVRSERKMLTSASPKDSLVSPKDFKTAINMFLEKTDD